MLKSLGCLLGRKGQHGQALCLLRRAAKVFEKGYGDEHPEYLKTQIFIASELMVTSDFEQAEKILRRTRYLNDSSLSPDPNVHAQVLNNLAKLLVECGNYGRARPLLDEVVSLTNAMEPLERCFALNNLGMLHERLGNSNEAIRLQSTAVKIAIEVKHPDLPAFLLNAGSFFARSGEPDEAERLYHVALERLRDSRGSNHEFVATCLRQLATVCIQTGRHEEAEGHLLEALNIDRTLFGEGHWAFAVSLGNLGACYLAAGKSRLARICCEKAEQTLIESLGFINNEYISLITNIAFIEAAEGRHAGALSRLEEANRITDSLLGQVFPSIAENERLSFIRDVNDRLDLQLSFVRQFYGSAEAVGSTFDLVQRRKGVGAEASATLRMSILAGAYPHLRAELDRLTWVRGEIADLALAGPGAGGPDAHRIRLAELEAERNSLEAQLSRQIPEMSLEGRLRAFERRELAASLSPDSALVEYVLVQDYDFLAPSPREDRPDRYLAFVLLAGQADSVYLADLGDAQTIDSGIAEFRNGILTGTASRDVELRPAGDPKPVMDLPGHRLRQLILDPILALLGGRTRLVIAADSGICLVPFEVIPTASGRRMIDDFHISYVSVGRDVLRHGFATGRPSSSPIVAADPDFDLSVENRGESDRDAPEPPGVTAGTRFEPLPGARLEGAIVANLLGVEPWIGSEVRKARLRVCESPRVLHIATHGCFLPGPPARARAPVLPSLGAGIPSSRARGLATTSRGMRAAITGDQDGGEPVDNPMLRSLLALAGANTWFRLGELPEDAGNGLLTAEDVCGLDLQETELVVLSACQTGLGSPRSGEGVFGLRRAFVLAGAKTLVVSLWSVPDQQTQELMEEFYRRLLKGEPRAEALRSAQLSVKGRHPEPLFWGGFICQGDPGPLQALKNQSQ